MARTPRDVGVGAALVVLRAGEEEGGDGDGDGDEATPEDDVGDEALYTVNEARAAAGMARMNRDIMMNGER